MKVIGLTGYSGRSYLIEATEREISQLFGNTDREWADTKLRHMRPAYGSDMPSIVGLEINVEAAYAQLAWLRRRNAEFIELIHKLRSTASAIEDSRPLFTMVTGEDAKS